MILRSEFCWKEVQDIIFLDCYLCSPLREGTVNVSNKLWCNKSEGSWQKFPPYKICWPTWGSLCWSQATKKAEKLRVASLSGWHHSGAVWWWLSITMVFAGDDDDDDYLLSILVFAGPIFLSTFPSRCAKWRALVERKFNTWLIINCHRTLISSHIAAQLNFQLNSRLNLRK